MDFLGVFCGHFGGAFQADLKAFWWCFLRPEDEACLRGQKFDMIFEGPSKIKMIVNFFVKK